MPRKPPEDGLQSKGKKKPKTKTRQELTEKTVEKRVEEHTAEEFLPKKITLDNLRAASEKCQGCDLYKNATQTVFGDGNPRARVMFVGEQPGDAEDKAGEPFVGPAGKLLRKALSEAGISEETAYFTNAVKHFKYEWRGKRRLHAKPRRLEVLACMPWLEAEIQEVKPHVIVCLGATAAQALLGPTFRITKQRGQFIDSGLAPHVVATVHPSSILRAPDDETRHEEMARFIADLKKISKVIEQHED
jgi:uracil-DNA glycosylase family protein